MMMFLVFSLIVLDGGRLVRSSPSAKVQIFSGTDKHRTLIGVTSEVDPWKTIYFYILTKFGVKHNNFI